MRSLLFLVLLICSANGQTMLDWYDRVNLDNAEDIEFTISVDAGEMLIATDGIECVEGVDQAVRFDFYWYRRVSPAADLGEEWPYLQFAQPIAGCTHFSMQTRIKRCSGSSWAFGSAGINDWFDCEGFASCDDWSCWVTHYYTPARADFATDEIIAYTVSVTFDFCFDYGEPCNTDHDQHWVLLSNPFFTGNTIAADRAPLCLESLPRWGGSSLDKWDITAPSFEPQAPAEGMPGLVPETPNLDALAVLWTTIAATPECNGNNFPVPMMNYDMGLFSWSWGAVSVPFAGTIRGLFAVMWAILPVLLAIRLAQWVFGWKGAEK